MLELSSLADLETLIGTEFGPGDWESFVSQEEINAFAEATGDHQFIHVDPAACKAFGIPSTIAHGHLLASRVPYLLVDKLVKFPQGIIAVNKGDNTTRFLHPVAVDSKVRLKGKVKAVDDKGPKGKDLILELTMEIEGVDSMPALVTEVVYRIQG